MSILVEFIGCSGSGKTTLAQRVYFNLRHKEGLIVRYPLELFLGRYWGQRITSDFWKNILLDLFVFPWGLLSLLDTYSFLKFSIAAIWSRTDKLIHRLLLLRSVLRKIGIAKIVLGRKKDYEIVLVDEGPVHSSHVIFVNGDNYNVKIDIDTFARLVPKPHIIVYVDTPFDIVMNRTLGRVDKPIKEKKSDELFFFISRAYEMFKQLKKSKCLQEIPTIEVSGVTDESESVIRYINSCFKKSDEIE